MALSKQISNTKKRLLKWSWRLLSVYFFVAIFAQLLANRNPLFIKQNDHFSFPALSSNPYVMLMGKDGSFIEFRKDNVDWKNINADIILFAPVPYGPTQSDMNNSNFVSPFESQFDIDKSGKTTSLSLRFRHWLGTTKTGADVLSGLIYGTCISMMIGIGSIIIATLIGFFLGSLAGYFGDYSIRIPKIVFLTMLLMLIPAWFYSFGIDPDFPGKYFKSSLAVGLSALLCRIILFFIILIIPILIWKVFRMKSRKTNQIFIPVDSLISRLIELFISVPRLVLIITLAAFTRPSVINIILIIGCTVWTDIARLVRMEMLRLRTSGFVEASRAVGMPVRKIITTTILPNALGPLSVMVIFGVAAAILTEAGLSFLGIGIPDNLVSWGTLLYLGRSDFAAWWLIIFPGCSLTLLIIILNIIGDSVQDVQHSQYLSQSR